MFVEIEEKDLNLFKTSFDGLVPFRSVPSPRRKLRLNCAAIQVPIGLENKLEGFVDLIDMKAHILFDASVPFYSLRLERSPARQRGSPGDHRP